MFTSLTSDLDFAIKAVELTLFLVVLAYVGLGFIFRLLFKIFKIRFSNSKLSNTDNQVLDLQLIRLYHGITLESVSDIELFSDAIASGKVKAPKGWLLPSYQVAGKRKLGIKDSFFTYFLILLIIIFVIVFAASVTKGQKYNYAQFSNGHEHALVSKIYVYDPVEKRYYNKNLCNKLTSKDKEVVRTACGYMLTNDIQMKNELENAIQTNNTNYHIVGSIFTIFYLIAICILISYPRFYKFNNEFYEFKKDESRPLSIKNKLNRYRTALQRD